MIRYRFLVLFICVCLLNSVKAQVIITQSGNCANNGYLDFFRCMIQCYEEQYGITGLIEEDYCSNGVQVIIEGSGGVSYTVQDVKEAVQCVTGKCQSAVPASICGDDSSPIVTNLPDDLQDSIIQDLNSGKYYDAESDLQSESRKRQSQHRRSHSRHHSKKTTHHHHRRMHRRKHLLKKLADAYGIKGDQLDELLAKLQKAAGSQQGSGQTDTSSTQSGQTYTSTTPSGDTSTTQSGQADTSVAQSEDETLKKLVEASEKLKERTDTSGIQITQVEELLTKLVEASGAQTYQDNAAASDLLSKLLDTSGLQIGQLNELLKTLEDVSGKKTGQLNDVSGILSALMNDSGEYSDESGEYSGESGEYSGESGEYSGESGEYSGESGEYSDESGEYSDESGEYTDEPVSYEYVGNGDVSRREGLSPGSETGSFAFASGPQSKSIASALGPQSKSIASASGPQSEAFASAFVPVEKSLVPANRDYHVDCEELDRAENEDSRSSTSNAATSDSNITPISDATSDSTVSGTTPESFSTDTTSSTTASGTPGSTSSGTTDSSGTSTGGSSMGSLSSGSTPDESLDDCYEYEGNTPDLVEVPKAIGGNGNNFQSASAVAVASSGSNSFGELDYNYDYDNDTYSYYDNDTYSYYNNDTGYYYDNNTFYDYPNRGNANAFAGVQGVNLNTDSKQYQGTNVESGSTSIGGIQINQNPIIESYQTNGQNTGGQNTGLLSNTFVQNLGFNQNPYGLNKGVGVVTNGQNTGPLPNAPIERKLQNQNQDQLQNIFAQIQGTNQQLPIWQNQGNNNRAGAIAISGQAPGQFVNSFMQNQGIYSNPTIQQYQSNQYSSGVSTNQQYLSQSANTPLQPNIYPSNGASVGTISFTGSGSSGQMQPNSANTPVQNQAFFGSNIRNGPLNIPQNNGFAQQTSAGGSNPFVVSSSATAGADSREWSSGVSQASAVNNPVPSQAGIFGPSLNYPQTNGDGIYSASNLGSATAGAFAGSSLGNIPQNNGFAQQTSAGGSNPFVVSSSATAGANSREWSSGISQASAGNNPVPSQAGVFGPSLNYPQTNGDGIYSASSLGSATADAFAGSSLGNIPALNIPQYNGNAAQTNGGIGQIARGAGASNFAPGALNNGANSAYQGFIGPGISINSQSFSGNIPTNPGAVSYSGSAANGGASANTASFAYTGNLGNAGSSENAGRSVNGGVISSANVQSFAM